MPIIPRDFNPLDSFTRSPDSMDFLERSFTAHRLFLRDEALSHISSSLGSGTASSDENSPPNQMKSALAYDDFVTRRVGHLARQGLTAPNGEHRHVDGSPTNKWNALIRDVSSLRSNSPMLSPQLVSSLPLHAGEELSALRAVLPLDELHHALSLDILDLFWMFVDQNMLAMTLSQNVVTRPMAPVSMECFVYVVSRMFARTIVCSYHHEARSRNIQVLLDNCRKGALELFNSVDVDHVNSVLWENITTALVEEAGLQHDANNQADAAKRLSQALNASPAADEQGAQGSLTNTLRDCTQHKSHYDTYSVEPFPKSRGMADFPGAVTAVEHSPWFIFEGRTSMMGICHGDDIATVRHVIPRHRGDVKKIAMSCVVGSAMVEADKCPSVLVVIEVDLRIRLYDFGPKRRRELILIKDLACPTSITAAFYLPLTTLLYVGDRLGRVIAINLWAAVIDATRKPEQLSVSSSEDEASLTESSDEEATSEESEIDETIESVSISNDSIVGTAEDYQMIAVSVHKSAVTGFAMASASTLLTSSIDGTVVVHNAATMALIRSFRAHSSGVISMVADPKNELIVTQAFDSEIVLWFTAHGVNNVKLEDPLLSHKFQLASLVMVPSCSQVLTIDISGLVKVWSLPQGNPVTSFHASWSVDTLSGLNQEDGNQEVARIKNLEGIARFHSQMKGSATMEGVIPTLHFDVRPVQSVAYDHRHHKLYVRGHHNDIVASQISGKQALKAHRESVRAILSVPTSQSIATVTASEVRLWSCKAMELCCELKAGNAVSPGDLPPLLPHQESVKSDAQPTATESEVCAACLDPTGAHLYVALSTGVIRCHRMDTGKCVKVFVAKRITSKAISLHHGRRKPVARSQPVVRYCGYSLDAVAMCFLPLQHELAVIYVDGAIRFFDDFGSSRFASRHQLFSPPKPSVLGSIASVAQAAAALSRARRRSTAVNVGNDGGPDNACQGLIKTDADVDVTMVIQMAVFSTSLRLLAASVGKGVVKVIDVSTNDSQVKVVQELIVAGEVTCMHFLDQYPCLLVGTSLERIEVFLVRGSTLLALVQDLQQEVGRNRRTSRTNSIAPSLRPPSASGANAPSVRRRTTLNLVAQVVSIERLTSVWKFSARAVTMAFDSRSSLLFVGTREGKIVTFALAAALMVLDLRITDPEVPYTSWLASTRKQFRDDGQREAVQYLLESRHQGLSSALSQDQWNPSIDDVGSFRDSTSNVDMLSNSQAEVSLSSNDVMPGPQMSGENFVDNAMEVIVAWRLASRTAVCEAPLDFMLSAKQFAPNIRSVLDSMRKRNIVGSSTSTPHESSKTDNSARLLDRVASLTQMIGNSCEQFLDALISEHIDEVLQSENEPALRSSCKSEATVIGDFPLVSYLWTSDARAAPCPSFDLFQPLEGALASRFQSNSLPGQSTSNLDAAYGCPITSIVVLPSGLVLSSSIDGTVALWTEGCRRKIENINPSTSVVSTLADVADSIKRRFELTTRAQEVDSSRSGGPGHSQTKHESVGANAQRSLLSGLSGTDLRAALWSEPIDSLVVKGISRVDFSNVVDSSLRRLAGQTVNAVPRGVDLSNALAEMVFLDLQKELVMSPVTVVSPKTDAIPSSPQTPNFAGFSVQSPTLPLQHAPLSPSATASIVAKRRPSSGRTQSHTFAPMSPESSNNSVIEIDIPALPSFIRSQLATSTYSSHSGEVNTPKGHAKVANDAPVHVVRLSKDCSKPMSSIPKATEFLAAVQMHDVPDRREVTFHGARPQTARKPAAPSIAKPLRAAESFALNERQGKLRGMAVLSESVPSALPAPQRGGKHLGFGLYLPER